MTDITILTQSSCPSCERAKEILSQLIPEFTLNVREVGLETDEGRNLALQHGVVFAPGILINGELFSYGRLSENKLRARLSSANP